MVESYTPVQIHGQTLSKYIFIDFFAWSQHTNSLLSTFHRLSKYTRHLIATEKTAID